MKIIQPSYIIEDDINGYSIIQKIERAGRTCYKSENQINERSSIEFVNMIIKNGHESVLEHEKISVRIICDRGISHEIVRHRIASYSQESTRYCNYSSNKFGNELSFIKPCFWPDNSIEYQIWVDSVSYIEKTYMQLINLGVKPQEARSILPNSLKTEIVVTMNLREWRHFFKLRTSNKAHPQMQEIARPLLEELRSIIPVVFDDITY